MLIRLRMLIVRALSRLVLMFLRMSVERLCRMLMQVMLIFAGLGLPLAHANLSRRRLRLCVCPRQPWLSQLALMLRLRIRARILRCRRVMLVV